MLQTPQVKTNSSSGSPSEEQLAEAERLKTDGKTICHTFTISGSFLWSSHSKCCMFVSAGNDQMKVENFSAAVEFYSKAIQLNPQNAVYYCNRYMHS